MFVSGCNYFFYQIPYLLCSEQEKRANVSRQEHRTLFRESSINRQNLAFLTYQQYSDSKIVISEKKEDGTIVREDVFDLQKGIAVLRKHMVNAFERSEVILGGTYTVNTHSWWTKDQRRGAEWDLLSVRYQIYFVDAFARDFFAHFCLSPLFHFNSKYAELQEDSNGSSSVVFTDCYWLRKTEDPFAKILTFLKQLNNDVFYMTHSD